MKKIIKWNYNIGDVIKRDNLDLTIIDRRIKDTNQQYKIKCNRCGFDSGNHIPVRNNLEKEEKEEYWIFLNNLKKLKSCPCCGEKITVIVPGINDITTTDPWMISYFPGGYDQAKLYTANSGQKVLLKCPDCGNKRYFTLCVLKNTGYMPCDCRMLMSVPNKISYYVFKTIINQLDYYEREYSRDWCGSGTRKSYSYDNYFEVNNKKYIVEMDGGLGHGKNTYKSSKRDTNGIKRDIIKDNLAKEHNIEIIRVECPDCNYHQIYLNLLDKIKNIVDISCLDEAIIMKEVHKNFIKVICDYYNDNKNKTMQEIADEFNIHVHTLRDYLKFGNRYNWCNYQNNNTKTIINIKPEVIKLYKDGNEIKDISKILNISLTTVRKYLQNEGLLEVKRCISKGEKIVYVYDLNLNYINVYPSQNELERRSLDDFGKLLRSRSISRVCTGERKQYKGYIFSFTKLHNEQKENK